MAKSDCPRIVWRDGIDGTGECVFIVTESSIISHIEGDKGWR
jgi:hypothetical protein